MKKLNDLELLTLRLLLDEMTYDCSNCGGKRTEVKFMNLPPEPKQGFHDFKDDGRFLYCPICKSYSVVIDD